jgi:hypothetical protein
MPSRPTQAVVPDACGVDPPVPGWRFNFIAGFVPLAAGLLMLMATWVGVTHPDSAWWIGSGTLDFTFGGLSSAGPAAGSWVQVVGSVGGVNVAAAAVAVSVVAWFGLRAGRRWAWWFLLFSLLWVGLHDAVAATAFFAQTGAPLMLMPYTYCVLMIVGLVRSRRAVFSRDVQEKIPAE